ncbi:hypothetical protein K443DRAFT_477660 [Laccaria amethystina LaAM-08-1]|uniref:Uncharacterized protein n=1 Tax=Laccaria amethystina LaAM-08-1 TaxID=1095629 RepID=A0A0C9WTI8_9AGAR|nr:hypothetical protein K443DRAFT_477660 [Laccaria amethystina LaAM-08-1]
MVFELGTIPATTTATTESSDSEVEAVARMARGLHLEQRLDDSETSTASESSTGFASSESDKLSAPLGAPIYTTGMIMSTWPTNFDLNFESNLNTPLNLLNNAVRDGGLNAGTNSATDADGGMPKQRVSFDDTGGSGSLTTTRGIGQAFSQLQARGSDPIPSSPALRASCRHDPNRQRGRTRQPRADSESPNITINLPFRSPSPSHPRSRAVSPLPEEKFEPVNPFKWLTQIRLSWSRCCPSTSSPRDLDLETDAGPGPDAISGPGTPTSLSSNSSNGPYNGGDLNLKFINVASIKSFCEAARFFVSDTLPRQVYHNFLLLRLPAMYSSRVARMVGLEFNSQGGSEGRGGIGVDSASGTPFHGGSGDREYLPGSSGHQGTEGVSGVAANGFDSWEAFIDSSLREWKTLNVVSAVLTSKKKCRTILAILQIPEAADDPITRSTALLSFICALMSLLYGYIYIVRFGTMRSMYRAWGWAEVRFCFRE